MKFITSTFSLKMFLDENFDLQVRKLTKEQFCAMAYDAYSCIGYEDVAKRLHMAYNEEPIKARDGDIILAVDVKKNGAMSFRCIRVCAKGPLLASQMTEEIGEI